MNNFMNFEFHFYSIVKFLTLKKIEHKNLAQKDSKPKVVVKNTADSSKQAAESALLRYGSLYHIHFIFL